MDDDKLLLHALEYAAQGWPVFPCNATKNPLNAGGFLNATTNPETIREWWERWPAANIGFSPGSVGMMVVDIDPGAKMEEIHAAVGGLPDTGLRATTPRGGSHRYYALAEGEEVPPSTHKIARNVDVRSSGSYVLLPPSYVVDRSKGIDGPYTWDNWPQPKPAYRTQGMVKAAGEKRDRSSNADRWIIDPDLPENIRAAVEYLTSERCRPAIEGQGGDKMTYDTAAMMRSFGLSPETALRLLDEVYSAKCYPPWDYDALQVKVTNAYEYATSAPGNMTPAYARAVTAALFKPVSRDTTTGGTERIAGRYRFVDREGIEEIAEPQWLVPNLLPVGGHAMLVASPRSFKTFLALDIAASVATGSGEGDGRVWPDIPQPGPVIYALGEGRSGAKLRIRAWEKRHNEGRKLKDFYLVDPVPLVAAGPEDWQQFIDEARRAHEDYALIVLDTVSRAMQGLNENAQQDATKLTQLVSILQAELGAAVLLLAHTPQGNAGRKAGSYTFDGDADTILIASREGKENKVTLTMTKQKEATEWEEPVTVTLAPEGSSLVAVKGTRAATPAAEAAKPATAKPGATANPFKPTQVALGIIETALLDVLAANPTRAWTQKSLAEAIAMRPEIEVSSDTLRGRTMTALRETSGSKVNKSYDPATSRWRHAG